MQLIELHPALRGPDLLGINANIYLKVTLSLSDEDFGKLASGKAKPQRLFMSGKLKVKGDVMKAVKLETILFKNLKAVQSKL